MLHRKCRALCFIVISSLICLVIIYILFYVSTFTSDRLSMNASFDFLKKDNANAFNDTSQCPQTVELESPHLIEVLRGTLLYSAWFDVRNGQSCIQVLLMTSHWKSPPLFSCRFQNGTTFNISMGAVTPYYIKKNSPYSNSGLFWRVALFRKMWSSYRIMWTSQWTCLLNQLAEVLFYP